jgi:hypothetical protein
VKPNQHEALSGLDVQAYLAERNIQESFVLAEIGHQNIPIAPLQHNLNGQRAYVGVEAWFGSMPGQGLRRAIEQTSGKNASFVRQHVATGVTRNEVSGDWMDLYDPTTVLPDAAADEVFMGNVFGENNLYSDRKRTVHLAQEAARLIGENGMLVVRETTTPDFAKLDDVQLARAGLVAVHRESFSTAPIWRQLEQTYNGGNQVNPWTQAPRELGFYLFAKQATR